MLVDAETLEPCARRVLSRVRPGERMDQARAVRVVRRDHDDRREHAGGGRGGVAPAAARGGRAGGGARSRGARDRLASHCTRAYSARAGRALRAPEGETRAAALPAAGLRPPRARVRPRPGHLPAGVRGRLAQPAGPPRRLRELAVLGRRGERSALDPLPDPARDADRRDASRTASLGRLAGRDPRRQHAPPLGRVAAAGVRNARSSRARPADIGPADRPSSPPRCRGSSGRRRSSTGQPFDRDEYAAAARRRRAGRRRAGGRAPARARAARLPCGRSRR